MKLTKTLSDITSVIIALTAPISFYLSGQDTHILTSSAAIDENATYNSWQEGYHAVLNDFMNSGSGIYASKNEHGEDMCSTYAIHDLNGDGVPELFINYQPITASGSVLYTFYDSKVVKLRDLPKAGFISYCVDDGIIQSSGGGGAGGWGYVTYSRIVNGAIEDIDSFGVSWATTPNTYSRNGVEISESEYTKYISQYQAKSWQHVGRENYFDDLYCKVGDIYYDYFFDYYMAWFLSSESTASTITIPSKINGLPVTLLGQELLYHTSTVETLNIPASIGSYYYNAFNCKTLETINVDSSHPDWISKNGVLYSRDMTTLLKYPPAKDTSTYTVPSSVTDIDGCAFSWCSELNQITLPETVDAIFDYAFFWCPNLSSVTILNPDCYIEYSDTTICNSRTDGVGKYLGVIRGYEGSTAQEFADCYDITFISLGEDPSKVTTTTTTTTIPEPATTTTITTTTVKPTEPPVYSYSLGDINGDEVIDASDASLVLEEYSLISTSQSGKFSDNVKKFADIDKNGTIDSSDSSLILAYYSYISTGGTITIEQWLNILA